MTGWLKVSISIGGQTVDITQRMLSAGTGVCTLTYLNTKVSTSSSLSDLKVHMYFNESYKGGDVGYYGLSGLQAVNHASATAGWDRRDTTLFSRVLEALQIERHCH